MGPSELPPLTAGTVGCWNALDKAKVKKLKKLKKTERQRHRERDRQTGRDKESQLQ